MQLLLRVGHEFDFADLDEHGRGIFLIRAVMDSVEYCRLTDGNVLEMHKNVA